MITREDKTLHALGDGPRLAIPERNDKIVHRHIAPALFNAVIAIPLLKNDEEAESRTTGPAQRHEITCQINDEMPVTLPTIPRIKAAT